MRLSQATAAAATAGLMCCSNSRLIAVEIQEKSPDTLISQAKFVEMVKHAHGMESIPEDSLQRLFVVIGQGNGQEDRDADV